MDLFLIVLIGALLYPIYWIYDNTVDGDESKGYKVFAFIAAVIIFVVAFFLFFPTLLINQMSYGQSVNGIGFVFIDVVGVIFSLIILLVMIAMFMWVGWAVGSAIDETLNPNKSPYDTGIGGDAIGALIGLVLGVLLVI